MTQILLKKCFFVFSACIKLPVTLIFIQFALHFKNITISSIAWVFYKIFEKYIALSTKSHFLLAYISHKGQRQWVLTP